MMILDAEVENCVLVLKSANSILVAKADALGAVAIVAQEIEQPPFELPYLQFDDVSLFANLAGSKAIVLGDEKLLVVLDQDKNKFETKKAKLKKKP